MTKMNLLPTIDVVAEYPPVRWLRHSRMGKRILATPRVKRLVQRSWNRSNARLAASFAASSIERQQQAFSSDGTDFRADRSSTIATRFIVLSEGRSGSTLLVDELGRRWKEIRSEREMFNRGRAQFASFEGIAHRTFFKDTGHRIVGCKIFYGHVSTEQLTRLLELDGMRVIILRRRNLLRGYVSLKIAQRTEIWREPVKMKVASPTLEERRLTIDPLNFYRRAMTSIESFRQFRELTESLPRIEVYYEDLSADLNNELRRIATFLGAGEPIHELPPILTRQNPEPLRSLILNFDEIRTFLDDVGMSEFIEMDDSDKARPTPAETLRCWPTNSQKQLFTAILGPENTFEERWKQWLSQASAWSTPDDLDGLHSTLHQRLRRSQSDSAYSYDFHLEWMGTIASNLRFRTRLAETIDQFRMTGVKVTVIGDAALALMISGGDSHLLRLKQIILVPDPDYFEIAIRCLEEDGWSIHSSSRDDAKNVTLRFTDLTNLEPLEVRLNRQVLDAEVPLTLDEELGGSAVTLQVGAQDIRVLTKGDLLFCTIIDGILSRPARSTEWFVRSHAILSTSQNAIDWDRFIELTTRYGFNAAIREAIELIEEITPGTIDAATLQAIRSIEISDSQRDQFRRVMTPQ